MTDAVRDALAEILELCAIGDVDECTEALGWGKAIQRARAALSEARAVPALTFDAFRAANVARCVKWHPEGIASWSPSDWLTAVTGELGTVPTTSSSPLMGESVPFVE